MWNCTADDMTLMRNPVETNVSPLSEPLSKLCWVTSWSFTMQSTNRRKLLLRFATLKITSVPLIPIFQHHKLQLCALENQQTKLAYLLQLFAFLCPFWIQLERTKSNIVFAADFWYTSSTFWWQNTKRAKSVKILSKVCSYKL